MITFRVFVKVGDVGALVWADGLRADQVAHSLFLAVDLFERPICVPLPVNLIAVNLWEQAETEKLWTDGRRHTLSLALHVAH